MRADPTRRQILFAGAGLLIAGCAPRRDTGPLRLPPSRPISRPASEMDPPLRYVIRKGDTLSSISRRSGLSVAAIADANRLHNSLIKPGQVLLLPGVEILNDDPLAERLLRAENDHRVSARGYALIPRRAWTRNRVRSNHRAMNGVKRITVHHTGEHKGMVGKSDRQIVKAIENYHRNGRKWSAIGYHYLIGRDHRVYEGRPTHIQGAHVSGHNAHNIGVSMIGDFELELPDRQQLGVLERLLDDLRRRYGVPRDQVYGHRDLNPSVCPGQRLHAWVRSYRAGAV